MKKVVYIAFAALILLASCSKSVVHTKSKTTLPPGQMKKLTGTQSAKSYAPGQQKKATTTTAAPAKTEQTKKKK